MKTVEGIVRWTNEANGYYYEWWYLDRTLSYDDDGQEWLKEFTDKYVKITIEEIKHKD